VPNFDLSSVLEARVAGQEVNVLRVANQVVWQKPIPSAHYSIFTTQTPTGVHFSDDTPLTVGTVFFSEVDGTVDAIRYFAPDQRESGRQGALWEMNSDTTATQIGSVIDLNTTVDADWNTEYFTTPISIIANQRYCASVFYPNFYVATSGFFQTGEGSSPPGIVNGPLVSPVTGFGTPGYHNGRFHEEHGTGILFPNDNFQGNCYFADVIFTPS
jgi:hypothetical protein